MLVPPPSAAVSPPIAPAQLGTSTPAALDDLERAKGAFLASLNHEIRTPLSGILGMVDLLLETELNDEQREYANTARLCAESLYEILNATLEYSALEAGLFTLDDSEFSLQETLNAALAQQQAKAAAKNLSLILTIDATLPETMTGDAPRLRELLGHLLSNAVKFTPAGTVELIARAQRRLGQEWLVVTVRDTGIGIAPDRLEAIFESFQQGESGLARTYPGLGLGLALARKLSWVMGGGIHAESQMGVGSTFTVELPLRRPGQAPQETATEKLPGAVEGPRILAVDDNLVGLTVLRHRLERHNLRVDYVASGREALEAAAKCRYDLVLMDLQMPEMDGLTAAVELRRVAGCETVPIVALTANYSDQVRDVCLAHGMQAFICKPVEANELWLTISRFLKQESR